ncbi:MAG TPA: hypothetical protein VM305_05720 [Candidatus Limnocylindrales bacterium]|nr:hypothetical protein [Candidatus Limnocylindrales bacterium]
MSLGPIQIFPVLLLTHIGLALALLLPSLLLPLTLRSRGPDRAPGPFVGLLLWLQSNGSLVIGGGLAVTGVAMLVILGPILLTQLWLQIALVLYAANLLLAFFIQRPGLRRLVGVNRQGSEEERERWKARARRQRYVSYVMAGGIGLIAFLMSARPQ